MLVSRAIAIGDRREIIGLRLADQGDGIMIGFERLLNGLVGDFNLAQQRCELGIAINRPPFAAIERVGRIGELPALLGFLEMRRDWRRGPHVIRPHHAAGETRT